MTTANTQPRVAEVREILSEVMDPEYGTLSIVDLGIVADVVIERDAVGVTLLPTMAGCPAREVIELDVRSALLSAGASNVAVEWCLDGSWEPQRLSTKAVEQLGKEFSIAIRHDGALPSCPICKAPSLREVSPVGPTRCRSVAWCDDCRNVVEVVG
ncbi:MAG: iron-sulfur cluster assembly protein [Ilumatobacteraceae bacterium]